MPCPMTAPRKPTGMSWDDLQPDALLTNLQPPAADQVEPAPETAPPAGLAPTVSELFKKANLLQGFDTQKVSWNPHKHCLAFVSGKNQVTVHDFEESDSKEPCILTSDHQTDVKVVEWRPNSGKMIAVGCRGGICLWSASYPGNVPFMKSGLPLHPSVPFLEVLDASGYLWMCFVVLLLSRLL